MTATTPRGGWRVRRAEAALGEVVAPDDEADDRQNQREGRGGRKAACPSQAGAARMAATEEEDGNGDEPRRHSAR